MNNEVVIPISGLVPKVCGSNDSRTSLRCDSVEGALGGEESLSQELINVSGPPPVDGADPNTIYTWDGPPPHRCCRCGWHPSEPGSLASLVSGWMWSEPTTSAETGLEWVCPACGELNVVCEVDHPWTDCPTCAATCRADLPWSIDCADPPPGGQTEPSWSGRCREDRDRARSILSNARQWQWRRSDDAAPADLREVAHPRTVDE